MESRRYRLRVHSWQAVESELGAHSGDPTRGLLFALGIQLHSSHHHGTDQSTGTMTTLKEKLGSEGQRDMDSSRLPCDLISPDTASVICCLFLSPGSRQVPLSTPGPDDRAWPYSLNKGRLQVPAATTGWEAPSLPTRHCPYSTWVPVQDRVWSP